MIVSIVLVALIATALGVIAAVRRGRVDQTVQVGAVVGDAIPGSYWPCSSSRSSR